jgi:hypothetical protein
MTRRDSHRVGLEGGVQSGQSLVSTGDPHRVIDRDFSGQFGEAEPALRDLRLLTLVIQFTLRLFQTCLVARSLLVNRLVATLRGRSRTTSVVQLLSQ